MTFVFWLFVKIFVYIITFLIISKAFDLVWAFVTLLFVLFDHNDIDSSGRSTKKLVQFLTSVQIRAFFSGLAWNLTQSLARLAKLAIHTTIMISRDVERFLDLRIFFVFEVSFHRSVTTRLASIAFWGHKSRLTGHFSFNIDTFFMTLYQLLRFRFFLLKYDYINSLKLFQK